MTCHSEGVCKGIMGNLPKCRQCEVNTRTASMFGNVLERDRYWFMAKCHEDGTPPEEAAGRILTEAIKAMRRLEVTMSQCPDCLRVFTTPQGLGMHFHHGKCKGLENA